MLIFRPHHFLCTIGFRGLGYDKAFIAGYQTIVDLLRSKKGDNIPITVRFSTDNICKSCPHKQGVLCQFQRKIEDLDERHANALSIREGDVLTWKEAKGRIVERIDTSDLKKICKGCSWEKTGICGEALVRLKEESCTPFLQKF